VGVVIAQDYSVWLTPERLAEEERLWAEVGIYQLYAAELLKVATAEGCQSVLELGCGTGWVPMCLPEMLHYVGVDSNPGCITLARSKNGDRNLSGERGPNRRFLIEDIRKVVRPVGGFDMVCAFAVMKHFALAEWAEVLARRVLYHGRVGLFTMNVGESDVDDFEQGFPHTWVSAHTLAAAVGDAGHQIVEMELLYTGETMVRTCIHS
jgi:SAM-dependent methyltransferase